MRKDIFERMEFMKKENIEPNYAELARIYQCDYRTVKRYFKSDGTLKERRKQPSKLDNFKEVIEEKVEISCTYTAIFKFIQKRGYEGKYTILREFARSIKIDKTNKATIRFETNPRLQAQVDWKEKLAMTSRLGEVFDINIFLMILGFSRMKYLQLTLDRNQDTLKSALINGFKYYQGIPKEILFDNMKTVVDQSRSNFQEAVINQNFYEFAKDMGFEVIACRPYRPQTKGKVEALAKLMSRLQPYNHEFDTIDQLDEIVRMLNDDLNHDISYATNKVPIDLHKIEKEYLLPLPNRDLLDNYLTKPITRVVTKEAMVTYLNNKYSLHPNYIGKTVVLKIDDNHLQIMFDGIVIASHPLSSQKFNYQKDHLIQILKSDAFAHKSDDEINRIAEKTSNSTTNYRKDLLCQITPNYSIISNISNY